MIQKARLDGGAPACDELAETRCGDFEFRAETFDLDAEGEVDCETIISL